jgi:hypothetical protein
MLYINRIEALKMGCTHEGTLFGVPAWFDSADPESESVPKFLPFYYWVQFADWCYETAVIFMRADQTLVSPVYVTGPIK